MDMGASSAAPPGTIPHPDHGTWEGHILPGTFFILWSSWWLFSNFRLGCRDCVLEFSSTRCSGKSLSAPSSPACVW